MSNEIPEETVSRGDSTSGNPPKSSNTHEKANRIKSMLLQTEKFGKSESYEKLNRLGEGTYAVVYKAYSKIIGAGVAIKEIKMESNEGTPCTALREISLLRHLNHPNIVCLHDVIQRTDKLVFVFEFAPYDLKALMKRYHSLVPPNDANIFSYQLLRGLEHCHDKKILHRDLKPQNILITRKGLLKIADFGLARSTTVPSKNYSSEVVTLWYRPPDVLLGSKCYDFALDIWSVGCIICELYTKSPLFVGKDAESQLVSIARILGPIDEQSLPGWADLPKASLMKGSRVTSIGGKTLPLPNKISPEVMPLVKSILRYNPALRPSCEFCLKHEAFAKTTALTKAYDNVSNMDASEIAATFLSPEFYQIVSTQDKVVK